ncbi:hypothetical protein VAZ01S_041_00070 [Vibrio azureus NBRC 104587]|uniref:Uncharacterized protein n=2 Tax=Vibrio azureus TaxID=512649 RepID=U3ASU9_9VIBR|nr:hypothetical protein VAZ01S_041_00070 [Vibrio azureus NBRC 104587]
MPRTGTHSFVGAYNDITHYRHVNNHDLVPQVPFKWANTNPDETSNSSKLSSLVLDLVVDNDDDNYHHHGNLVQLLTYSREKFQPQEVKQVLLTPKQTHITSLTFARNTQDDTFILADTLSKEHIDINGYKATILDSGLQHMMSEYIPNLKSQLKILLHGTLSQSYTNANTELTATIDNLNQAIQTLQEEYKQSKNISLRAIKKRRSLKLEEETITKLLANLKRIQRELGGLVNSPTVLPPGVLLYGDKQPLQIDLEGRING